MSIFAVGIALGAVIWGILAAFAYSLCRIAAISDAAISDAAIEAEYNSRD